jgi:hypothetical protein
MQAAEMTERIVMTLPIAREDDIVCMLTIGPTLSTPKLPRAVAAEGSASTNNLGGQPIRSRRNPVVTQV